jgi:hypothetical protein
MLKISLKKPNSTTQPASAVLTRQEKTQRTFKQEKTQAKLPQKKNTLKKRIFG